MRVREWGTGCVCVWGGEGGGRRGKDVRSGLVTIGMSTKQIKTKKWVREQQRALNVGEWNGMELFLKEKARRY